MTPPLLQSDMDLHIYRIRTHFMHAHGHQLPALHSIPTRTTTTHQTRQKSTLYVRVYISLSISQTMVDMDVYYVL